MNICAVIPAYNEREHIAEVIRGCRAQVETVLVVDDGSTDGTGDVARDAGAEVIRLETNRGKGWALCTAFQQVLANGHEACLTLDADGQHDPADIPALIAAYVREHPDLVVGSRMQDPSRMPWIRRVTNRWMSWLLSRMTGQSIPDTQCGFRLVRCAILKDLRIESARFAAESEILIEISRRGGRIISVPVRTIYASEHSKIHPVRDTLRFLGMVGRILRGRRSGP